MFKLLLNSVRKSKMFIIAAIILGSFGQLLADPRPCTKDDFCLPVPAGTCNNTQCLSFDIQQFAAFGVSGLKAYTWNIGQQPFLRFCPLQFQFEESKTYDGMISITAKISLNSGPDCNISTVTDKTFSFRPDLYTGLVDKLILDQAGDIYEGCFIYFVPGVALAYRSCKVDPLPKYGEECASIYAFEAKGVCNEDFHKFLENLKIDFKQVEVDCL